MLPVAHPARLPGQQHRMSAAVAAALSVLVQAPAPDLAPEAYRDADHLDADHLDADPEQPALRAGPVLRQRQALPWHYQAQRHHSGQAGPLVPEPAQDYWQWPLPARFPEAWSVKQPPEADLLPGLLPDREPAQRLERLNAGPALPAADRAQVQPAAGQQAVLLAVLPGVLPGVLLEEPVARVAARRPRAVLQDARLVPVSRAHPEAPDPEALDPEALHRGVFPVAHRCADVHPRDVHLLDALPQDARHLDAAQVQPVVPRAALARQAARDVRQVPALQLSAPDVADYRPAASALSGGLAWLPVWAVRLLAVRLLAALPWAVLPWVLALHGQVLPLAARLAWVAAARPAVQHVEAHHAGDPAARLAVQRRDAPAGRHPVRRAAARALHAGLHPAPLAAGDASSVLPRLLHLPVPAADPERE